MPNDAFTKWSKRVESCKDRRPLWEAQVATCMHFEAGNHKVWWDDKGQMRTKTVEDNEVFRTVNYFPSALAIILGRLMANDPRWNPARSELTDVTDEEVDAADAALQDIWEGDEYGDYSVKLEMKQVVRDGFLQSGRLAYYRFDDEAKMPVMDTFSLWDVYSDKPERLKDKQWLVIACPKSASWVKDNEGYDSEVRGKVEADNLLAESGLKQQFEQRVHGGGARPTDTVLLYYCFEIVTRQMTDAEAEEALGDDEEAEVMPDEEEMAGKERATERAKRKVELMAKKRRVIKYQLVCEHGVLEEGELPYPRLSAVFDIFKPVEDGQFYGVPPCYHWIDPSKSLDKTNSNIEAYMDNFLQGKWIIKNRSIVPPIAGRNGQRIYDESGSSIMQLPMQPLPQTHFQHKADQERHFERISGAHSASMGNAPSNIESGVGLSQIIAADEMNSADPVDNYKMFLKRSAKKLLRVMSDNWDEVRVLYRYDQFTRQSTPMKVIGERFYDKEDASIKDAVKLRAFRRLDLDLEIGAFFKQSQRRHEIIELQKAGWQPGANPVWDRIILPGFEIGVGREIVREIRKMQNPYSFIVQGNTMLIMEGQDIIVNEEDPHEFFWQFYSEKAKERMKSGDQRGATLLNSQAQKHAMMVQGMGGASTPEIPETEDQLDTGQGTDIV